MLTCRHFVCFGKDSTTAYKGIFGNAMPGKRIECFTVDDLDPTQCIGYNNIVVHCGINSIRHTDIKSESDIKDVYVGFKTKINNIIHVNKHARVYVNTLLPTKDTVYNKKVRQFNNLIDNDLRFSFESVRIINSYSKFVNSTGMISANISRDVNQNNQADILHLNNGGLSILSVCIKNAIFYHKLKGGGAGGRGSSGAGAEGQRGGVDYAAAAGRPRRGGHRYRGRRGRPQ